MGRPSRSAGRADGRGDQPAARRPTGRCSVEPPGAEPAASRARRPARRYSASAATTAAAGAATAPTAVRRSSSSVVRRWISTSMVAIRGPPRILTTPNDVKVNRNTIEAAPASAGRSCGRVTVRKHVPARGAERAGRVLGRGVDGLPRRADGAGDDGVVEEHVGEDDRGGRPPEVEVEPTRPAQRGERAVTVRARRGTRCRPRRSAARTGTTSSGGEQRPAAELRCGRAPRPPGGRPPRWPASTPPPARA